MRWVNTTPNICCACEQKHSKVYCVHFSFRQVQRTSIHKDVQDMWGQCWNSRFTESTKCEILDECWWKVKPVLLFHCTFSGTSRKRLGETAYMMNTVNQKRRNYQMLLGKLAIFSLPDPTPKATRKIGGSTWQGCRTEQNDMTHWGDVRPTLKRWKQEPLRLLVASILWVDWIRLIMVKKGTIQLQSCDLSWLWFGKMADRW